MIGRLKSFSLFLFILAVLGNNAGYADDENGIKIYDRSIRKSMTVFRVGIISRHKIGPSLAVMIGENFNKHIAGCLGVAYDDNHEAKAYELVLNLKGYPVPGNISPLIYCEIGYASRHSPGGQPTESGLVINIGSGLKIYDGARAYFLFEFGYKAFTDGFKIGKDDTNYEDNVVATVSVGL